MRVVGLADARKLVDDWRAQARSVRIRSMTPASEGFVAEEGEVVQRYVIATPITEEAR